MRASFALTARWVFPGTARPLEGGVVTVEAGRIANVSPRGGRTADLDLGNAALIPGLVNAHTHLDLTGMRGRVPPSADFTGWLREVIRHRRGVTPEQTRADIAAGLAESLRHGVTLVGDIAAGGASWDVLDGAPVWAVVYHELLGLPAARCAGVKDTIRGWRLRTAGGRGNCRPGLSPHAPYSTHWAIIKLAANTLMPFCTHLAESREELELLDRHRGPFLSFLRELGVWEAEGLAKSVKQILLWTRTPKKAHKPVFAHGNYLDPDAPVPTDGTVVYCPRTHAAFGHPPHPFRGLLARGVRVALGTDSLASNPDLDLLAEARFVRGRHPDVPGDALLWMATLAGAEALGFAAETGSLEVGKWADMAAVPLPDGDADDPHDLLFENDREVSASWWRGERRGT